MALDSLGTVPIFAARLSGGAAARRVPRKWDCPPPWSLLHLYSLDPMIVRVQNVEPSLAVHHERQGLYNWPSWRPGVPQQPNDRPSRVKC